LTNYQYLGYAGNEKGNLAMPKNTSVELGDEIVGFIDCQVKAGRYGSTSEVVRAGLRLLQDEETKMSALRSALIKGEQSGDPQPFDVDGFIASRKLAPHG
jgi:antitoxin ParD1/3/4